MQHAREPGTKELAVVCHARKRNAPEIYAVVAAIAGDEALALAVSAGVVVAERDLQRGVDGFGARVDEEDAVEIAGQGLREVGGEFEGGGLGKTKGR